MIVSAFRSRGSASAEVMALAFRHSFDFLLSVPLVLEYEAVLQRPEHRQVSGLSAATVERLVKDIISGGKPVSLGGFSRPNLDDPGDEHVLNLLLRGRADALVTHNVRHFEAACARYGVQLYTPRGFLTDLRR